MKLDYVYQRTAGVSGFPGTWDSVSEKLNSVYELDIQPYEGDGLSLISPAAGMNTYIKFDGNDYPHVGVAPAQHLRAAA